MPTISTGKRANGRICAAVITACAGLPALNASAQGEEQAASRRVQEEVLVTAQRRDQSIRDVPISITAFGAQDINDYDIRDMGDFALITPNLGFTSDGSPLGANINVRGVENIGGIANSIGVYVDEINTTPLSEIFVYDSNLFDIERIEVLRGPQGTLFGRNVLGGAVNITSVKPGDTLGASIDAHYGSFNERRLKASADIPITEAFSARGTVFYHESDGWLDNIGSADNTNDRESSGGRLAVRAQLSDQTVLDASVAVSTIDMGMPDAIPSGQQNQFYLAFGIPVDPAGDYSGIGLYPENDDIVSTGRPFSRTRDLLFSQARLEHNFGAMTGVVNLGFIDSDYRFEEDSDYADSEWFVTRVSGSVQSESFEARLQSNGNSKLNWIVGASYAEDKSTLLDEGVALPDLVLAVAGVQLPPGTETPVNGDNVTRGLNGWGIFSDVTWALDEAERLLLSVGARYSQDEVTDMLISEPNINNGFNRFQLGPVSETFDSITARLSLLYQLSDSANVYGTISRGAKPGGFNLFALNAAEVPETYEIETLVNYEVGAKGVAMEGRLSYGLSAFYMQWDDLQFDTVFVTDENIGNFETITLNAGKASSYGVELEFSALLTDRITLRGGTGYLQAELGDGDDVAPGVDVIGQPFDIDGNKLARSPEFSVNLSAEYIQPVFGNFDGFARIEGMYRSSQFEDVANGQTSFGGVYPSKIEGYGLMNIRLGVRDENLAVTLFGENLGNETEIIGVRESVSIAGSPWTLVRRQFGVRVTYEM